MRVLNLQICPKYPENVKLDGNPATLHAYLQDQSPELKHSVKRQAVIVCPGGAYRFKSDREGEPIAMRYLAAGMQAFVLQYSVAPSVFPAALLELAKAVAVVRANAKDWNIDPNQIYITGFSAGGHLCASLGTLWNDPVVTEMFDESEPVWKPDGMLLCYPVISMSEYGHEECKQLLMAEKRSELENLLSLQNRVTRDTVPTFLWSTQADDQVPIENSLMFAAELQKQGIPMEIHIYELGEHGIALSDITTEDKASQVIPDNTGWIRLAINWIRRRQG